MYYNIINNKKTMKEGCIMGYKKTNKIFNVALPMYLYDFFKKKANTDIIYNSMPKQILKLCIEEYKKQLKEKL